MGNTDEWTPSAEEQAGLKDFWETYESHYAEISAHLLKALEAIPQLGALVRQTPAAQLAEQEKVSREKQQRAMVHGEWGPLFADQRAQGALYASMGIRFGEWFDLLIAFEQLVVPAMVRRFLGEPERLSRAVVGMNAYIDRAMATIGEEYLKTKERIISQQQHAIKELSTPVLKLRDRLLLVPLVGVLDTQRARLMTEQLLNALRAHRAKALVIDITGVAAVDSKVANHLLQTVAAARLMGAKSVVTGLSVEVAQALVALGVDLQGIQTVGDLQEGLEEAERLLGISRVQPDAQAETAP